MIDNVLIVIVHVYSINNGGGPWHEPKNGAENSRLHRVCRGTSRCLVSVFLDLGGPFPVLRRKIRPETGKPRGIMK